MRVTIGIRTAVLAFVSLTVSVPLLRADEEQERVALRALKTLYEQAVNEDKVELLAPHVDPDFQGVMLTSDAVSGFSGMNAYWKKIKDLMGPSGRYRVAVTAEPAQFAGDIAFAQGRTEDVVTLPGKEYRLAGRWTAVCRKKDGAWKLYRIHASMDPIENPFVKDKIKASRLLYGGAGVLGGALLGVVLGRRKR
jgi:ketosteroid isomerase-like protein